MKLSTSKVCKVVDKGRNNKNKAIYSNINKRINSSTNYIKVYSIQVYKILFTYNSL